ncbi:hypothetical protein HPP92_016338 [Vanilla planifolia]|uniref:Uncharacterized protein n=1 Tax=Vanilla planifolia TaxID=51239 RepID=A0A835QJ47_VANPL|nr:hypothetical protein HPP92_016338 [Vanilla planifolia]
MQLGFLEITESHRRGASNSPPLSAVPTARQQQSDGNRVGLECTNEFPHSENKKQQNSSGGMRLPEAGSPEINLTNKGYGHDRCIPINPSSSSA